jgi:hypothetical protein
MCTLRQINGCDDAGTPATEPMWRRKPALASRLTSVCNVCGSLAKECGLAAQLCHLEAAISPDPGIAHQPVREREPGNALRRLDESVQRQLAQPQGAEHSPGGCDALGCTREAWFIREARSGFWGPFGVLAVPATYTQMSAPTITIRALFSRRALSSDRYRIVGPLHRNAEPAKNAIGDSRPSALEFP